MFSLWRESLIMMWSFLCRIWRIKALQQEGKADHYHYHCWHLTRDKEVLVIPLTLIYWGPLCRFYRCIVNKSTHTPDLWRMFIVQSLLFLSNIMRRPTSACSPVVRAALWSAHAQWRHSRWVMNAGLLAPGLSLGSGQPRCEVGPTEPWYKDHNGGRRTINVKWIRETYGEDSELLNDSGFWSFL